MKSYQYQLEELVKTWKSTYFTIEAKNKREADKIAKQIGNGDLPLPDNNWVDYDGSWDDSVADADSYIIDERGNTILEI